MSCRCSGTLSRRVSKQGYELLGACRAHRPLADAHVLHAKSSPALAPRFIACNTPWQFMILSAISIERNDCTQETPTRDDATPEKIKSGRKTGKTPSKDRPYRAILRRWAFRPQMNDRPTRLARA